LSDPGPSSCIPVWRPPGCLLVDSHAVQSHCRVHEAKAAPVSDAQSWLIAATCLLSMLVSEGAQGWGWMEDEEKNAEKKDNDATNRFVAPLFHPPLVSGQPAGEAVTLDPRQKYHWSLQSFLQWRCLFGSSCPSPIHCKVHCR